MHFSVLFDVPGPGLLIAGALIGFLGLVILTIVITLIEAAVLFWLKWDSFKRALLAAFLMNVVSTILGLFIAAPMLSFGFVGLLAAFVVSIVVEGIVLVLMKRGAARQNWIAVVVVNLASYLLVILPIYFLSYYN